MSTVNYSDTTPPAPSGGSNVKFQSDANGNISAYVPAASGGGGGSQTPWTGNIDAANNQLLNLAGPLGIGKSPPQYALDVAGDINLSGVVRVNGQPLGGGVPVSRQVIAGAGLAGGGPLSADVTLTANVLTVFGRTGNVVLGGADISGAGGVLTTRKINAGAGMAGGSDLSADITLSSFLNTLVAGAAQGSRAGLNFIAGANVTISAADNPANGRVDVTIGATGGGAQTPWTSDIDAAGHKLTNVGSAGIGTTTPSHELSVLGQAYVGPVSTFAKSGYFLDVQSSQPKTSTSDGIQLGIFSSDAQASNPLCLAISTIGNATAASRYAQLQVNEFGTANWRSLALNPSGGNVGIANSSPAYPLDVTGDIHCTGSVRTTTIAAGVATLSLNTNNTQRITIDSTGNYNFNSADGGTGAYITLQGAYPQIHAKTGNLYLISDAGTVTLETGTTPTPRLVTDAAGHVTINNPDDGGYGLVLPGGLGMKVPAVETITGGGFMVNTFWNGSAFAYRANGTALMMNASASANYISAAPAGTAGATATMTQMLTFAAPSYTTSNVPLVIALAGSTGFGAAESAMAAGSVIFELNSSNSTQFVIKAKGWDGVLRSATVTLA